MEISGFTSYKKINGAFLSPSNQELFTYNNLSFDLLRLSIRPLNGKLDGVKYLLIGETFGQIEVELVKTYWSGTLVVYSPYHVQWMAEKVKEIYGEIL